MLALPRCFHALVLSLSALFSLPVVAADPPGRLNHQGRIAVNSVNYNGTGYFKFAFVDPDGTTTYWSNDGSSTMGSEPTAAVSIPVNFGHYALQLGDSALTNMTVVPADVFRNNSDVSLRVWFSTDNTTFEQLSPDQPMASSAYALNAGTADGLSPGSVTSEMLADGAVTPSKMSPGFYENGDDPFSEVTFGGGVPLANGVRTNLAVSFPVNFASGSIPDIELPDGWSLVGPVTENGFSAEAVMVAVATNLPSVGGRTNWDLAFPTVIDVDGNAAIAYADRDRDQLIYTLQSSPDGLFNTPVVVDGDGTGNPNVGLHASMAMVGGAPAIAYQDLTNKSLK